MSHSHRTRIIWWMEIQTVIAISSCATPRPTPPRASPWLQMELRETTGHGDPLFLRMGSLLPSHHWRITWWVVIRMKCGISSYLRIRNLQQARQLLRHPSHLLLHQPTLKQQPQLARRLQRTLTHPLQPVHQLQHQPSHQLQHKAVVQVHLRL